MSMSYIQWFLVAMMIAVGFIGGYYQLQMIAYLKAGRRASVWTGGWIFHPEYLEVDGQPYRKKLLASWIIFLLLVAGLKILAAL